MLNPVSHSSEALREEGEVADKKLHRRKHDSQLVLARLQSKLPVYKDFSIP